MTKRTAATTTTAAVDAAQSMAAGFPEPPAAVQLRDRDRPFWDAVIRARLPGEWARVDLVHAAQLARTMADIESNRKTVLREGDLRTNKQTGITKVNPRHVLIEVLSRRAMSLTRLLQLHALPKLGPTRDQGVKKGEAMRAGRTMESTAGDDLLAKPTMQ